MTVTMTPTEKLIQAARDASQVMGDLIAAALEHGGVSADERRVADELRAALAAVEGERAEWGEGRYGYERATAGRWRLLVGWEGGKYRWQADASAKGIADDIETAKRAAEAAAGVGSAK